MKPLFSPSIHFAIYYFSLALLITALPLSVFVMSLSQLILLGNWVLEGNLKKKLQAFANNRIALVLASLLGLHLLGLLYTSDFSYGWEDIRKKAPLLLLPVVLSSSQRLTPRQFVWLLILFVMAVTAGTLISIGVLFEFIHSHKVKLPITDPRQISIFISHIRFSLLICMAIFILYHSLLKKREKWQRILALVGIVWFIIFLVIIESLTGLLVIAIAAIVLLARHVFTIPEKTKKIAFLSLLLFSIIGTGYYLNSLVQQYYYKTPIDFRTLEKNTSNGNAYVHDTLNTETENGNYIWLYLCEKELRESWNQRSSLLYDSTDLKGNELRYTLIRFLTSKNLHKDAKGIQAMNDEEIRAVEKGIANVDYQGRINIKGRINQIIWEIDYYRRGSNPSGHSLTQRFEYWKTAFAIINKNLLFGVGTGDVKTAFGNEYETEHSSLKNQWRLRSHNQFLAITVALGVIGLLWFLVTLFYPLFKGKKFNDYLYLVFFITAFISFFAEDTLETQPGVTFYAFFNCLLLFLTPPSNLQE